MKLKLKIDPNKAAKIDEWLKRFSYFCLRVCIGDLFFNTRYLIYPTESQYLYGLGISCFIAGGIIIMSASFALIMGEPIRTTGETDD